MFSGLGEGCRGTRSVMSMNWVGCVLSKRRRCAIKSVSRQRANQELAHGGRLLVGGGRAGQLFDGAGERDLDGLRGRVGEDARRAREAQVAHEQRGRRRRRAAQALQPDAHFDEGRGKRESRAQVAIVTGDARLSLTQEERHANRPRYDVLVLDAFSGDAVPVHLLTAEAISLYRKRLQPDGILAFHISSQYLDLAPVLTVQAEHAGMRAVTIHSAGDEKRGEFPADWVLFTTNPAFLELAFPPRYHYDVLRALDYFRAAGLQPEARIGDALHVVKSRQQGDGRWLLE